MLTALELHGFKSFPDRTRFEFPPGITVVVGPNGSGKSNIVDAMKWVLGEQSAKSLRGKEMADVIFKGSARGKRKPANTAEATIFFDNSTGILPIEATEVQVTRRVYRSGEGEYLINGQGCRLRDIKDLFRGTGVGTDAYSLIEQGKVDSLLRASPKDRRAIFEEAAGISRFKAKKIEAQRRLERVEQNLLRLSDIVEEVETRLKRVKSQASKAQRHKQYTDRLQSLRTHVGRVDWQTFTHDIERIVEDLADCAERLQSYESDLEVHEAHALEIDSQDSVVEETFRRCEARASRARERMAAGHSLIASQESLLAELDEELARNRRRHAALSLRAGDLGLQVKQIEDDFQRSSADVEEKQGRLQAAKATHDGLVEQVQTLRDKTESQRRVFVEKMRLAADLGNQITTHESSLKSVQESIQRATTAISEAEAEWQTAQAALGEKRQHLETAQSQQHKIEDDYETLRQAAYAEEQRRDQAIAELAQLKERHAALVARVTVLAEIETQLEGVGSGVREVLEAARQGEGAFAGVRGMVADLVQVVDPALADMIDVALGERAEHLVVAGQHLFELLEAGTLELSGRVGFLRLQSTPPPGAAANVALDGSVGVIGRADRLVQSSSEYAHLVSWLLRDTWLVESLEDALHYHRSTSAPIRLVTRAGELLDRDGRLLVGPRTAGTGIISRRAELRQVEELAVSLEQEVNQRQRLIDDAQVTSGQREQEIDALAKQRQAADKRLAKCEAAHEAASSVVAALQQRLDSSRQEFADYDTLIADTNQQLTNQREELTLLEEAIRQLELALASDRTALNDLEEELAQSQLVVTDCNVAVAKSEQQLDALQAQRDQLTRDQNERQEAIQNARQQLLRCQQRHQDAELRALNASSEIAEFAIVSQACQFESAELDKQRVELKSEKSNVAKLLAAVRAEIHQLQQRQHTSQMEHERIRHQRDSLADRLQEDYGIGVDQLAAMFDAEGQAERKEIDQEIESLRRKISNLGAVNLDALADLTELEDRFNQLSSQYNDLVDAKESLQRIIVKINADSRRLFAETLEIIRENFANLFRKVFGGGRADIVLEEGVDILESGIDLVATPPGKHSLGLSLLSGGERALTAVTLLLAIFEYRPSPFCVLDEVDGPLDEANIGRFIDVLREFLKWTKFVVVTHSKRTMTAATTLYGVTMQESGVSKRVTVRFEDVSEGGEISEDAIRRSAEDDTRGVA